ncbi:MAG: transposase, partial [Thiohalobacteraceae bacterium]
RDRLKWMRFLGFALGDRTPDKNTIRHFRNRMTETGTLSRVMKAFDWQLHKKAISPCPARSSMLAWCQRRSSATPRANGRLSRTADQRGNLAR